MEYVLTTEALCKYYKHFKALNGLTMHVPKGAIYGIVGKNGAGKTTLIRLLCGLQEPTKGSFYLYGVQNNHKGIQKARRRIGAVVETPSIYLNMTAEENIKEQYRVLGLPSFEGIKELLDLVGIGDTGKKKAKNFSLGMRQRLGIAIALCGDPDFLVLDELSRLATHYGFIDNGQIVKEISAPELEAACRKCLRMEVTDLRVLAQVCDSLKLEYQIVSDAMVDIYGKVRITEFVLALAKGGCEVLSVDERDESLESYYVSLIGGASRE